MRVLMIAPEPFREPRGTPISVFLRLQALASLGHSIDLVTYHLGENVDLPGVAIHRAPRVPFIEQVKVGPSWQKLLLDHLLFWKAVAMLAGRRYDVIHSHEEAAFFSILLSALFRTRHVYDMHSSLPRQLDSFGYGRYRPLVWLFALLERWAINSCDTVITIGSDLERQVKAINPRVRHFRIENLPVQSAGLGADAESVARLRGRLGVDGRFPILYTGTLERYQGLDLLMESAAIVGRHHPDVLFLIVGGKPRQVEHWKAEVRRRQLEEQVLFVGSVPLEEIPTYMELAEVLVSPRREGISVPLKIYSYLFSGKPIVATNLATHTLVLNEEVALLVDATAEALAEGIVRLIRDPGLRRRLGLRARKLAEESYNPADYLARLDSVYRGLESPARQPTDAAAEAEPGGGPRNDARAG